VVFRSSAYNISHSLLIFKNFCKEQLKAQPFLNQQRLILGCLMMAAEEVAEDGWIVQGGRL
jgi:hypothetical protein